VFAVFLDNRKGVKQHGRPHFGIIDRKVSVNIGMAFLAKCDEVGRTFPADALVASVVEFQPVLGFALIA
jgi:hypothetical protein